MAETPDFHSIATKILSDYLPRPSIALNRSAFEPLVEELRQLWNARGAADIAKIDHELTSMMGGQASGPYVKNLDRALRGLDR